MAENKGSVILGAIWMLVLSLLLVWLPAFGPLIAGIVGGKVAGGVGAGLMAALLPAMFLGIALFVLGTTLTGLPVVGVVFGASAFVLIAIEVGPLLVGALIGGLLA